MRKLLLFTLGLVALPILAQNEYWKNTGTAKSLQGKTYILSVYGATPSSFTEKQIKQHQTAMDDATDWLIKQAKAYGQNISFEFGEFYKIPLSKDLLVDGDQIEKVNEDHPLYSGSPIEIALGPLQYTPQDFIDFVKAEHPDCRNIIVMVFVNQQGRSYAHSYEIGDDPSMLLEGVMMFNSQDDATLASELSHEILHCFGAYDFYATDESQQEKQREKLMRKNFPNDIMLELVYADNPKKKASVGSFTAYAIGWLPTYNNGLKKKYIPAR